MVSATVAQVRIWLGAKTQPRSGERTQPTAQAVGGRFETGKPRRGEREAATQIHSFGLDI